MGMLLEAAVRSLGLAGLVWLGMRLAGVRAVMARRAAWVLVLACAVAMPAVMRLPVPAVGWRLPVAAAGMPAEKAVPVAGPVVGTRAAVVREMPRRLHRSGRVAGEQVTASAPVMPVAVEKSVIRWSWAGVAKAAMGLYGVVAGYLVVVLLVRLVLGWMLWRRAEPVPLELAGLLVRMSAEVTTPVNFGAGILLPADYREWPEETLRVVLAHEQAHVRQRDFWVMVMAGLHAAVFWFSPLAWWLKRTLEALAEELSDAAGVAVAASAETYAEILLKFAARGRLGLEPGVAMADSKHISHRIERILEEEGRDMEQGKSRFGLAVGLVVIALAGTVCLVRLVPVRAAGSVPAQVAQNSGQGIGQVEAPPVAQAAPVPQAAPAPTAEAEDGEDPAEPQDAGDVEMENGDGPGYVIVEGGKDSELALRGVPKEKAEKLSREHKGSYVYFERDGKGYVIDDPALVEKGKGLFRWDFNFNMDQGKLQAEMRKLQAEMDKLAQTQVRNEIESPEFKAKMDKLSKELGELEGKKAKELAERAEAQVAKLDAETQKLVARADAQVTKQDTVALTVNLDKIDVEIRNLDLKIGDIQGEIGDLHGEIGDKLGELGDKQGELGDKMGQIGEKMGKLGELQGRKAEEANRKMNKLLDEALKSGKAKPVE